MALSIGQVTLNNSTGVQFGVLPPGGTVTLNSVTAASTCYIGMVGGTSLTTANSYPVVSGQPPTTISLPVTSAGAPLFALGSGTNVLGYVFASDS